MQVVVSSWELEIKQVVCLVSLVKQVVCLALKCQMHRATELVTKRFIVSWTILAAYSTEDVQIKMFLQQVLHAVGANGAAVVHLSRRWT